MYIPTPADIVQASEQSVCLEFCLKTKIFHPLCLPSKVDYKLFYATRHWPVSWADSKEAYVP